LHGGDQRCAGAVIHIVVHDDLLRTFGAQAPHQLAETSLHVLKQRAPWRRRWLRWLISNSGHPGQPTVCGGTNSKRNALDNFRIGVVTGLTAEARVAAPLGAARAGGGFPVGATEAAAALVAGGATALISFGLAGGLNRALRPGTLIIPASVATPGAVFQTDAALTRTLGGPAHTLYAGTALAITAAEKAALHASTGADAIDVESGAVAEVASAHGLPFAVLRAICDPADSTLPPAAMIALGDTGSIMLARVARSLLRQPGQLSALLRLAAAAAAARRALKRQVRLVRPAYPWDP
jgi:adenosylhomocysteine nucleosidase